ncbi:MAG: potassium transporter Kup [Alphaproteobacteria bacterium]|nr:potassium transporter Kup [Alphaproteobacteria bacterium]
MLGAIGVVFGDIGTSPLYAMKESFLGAHAVELTQAHVYGVLSLVFWSVTVLVSIKYVMVIMRADNKGEGGSLALLALVSSAVQGTRMSFLVLVLGVFAAALFYGDSMITPAISVLSAVEGLAFYTPRLDAYVVPLTVLILVGLFVLQSRGTGGVGKLFGPIMVLWFVTLAGLGIVAIARHPTILFALSPTYAIAFFITDGVVAFLTLGTVVLAVTGAEALYADMGHFGREPIRRAWFFFVLPALMLNYLGQGAELLDNPEAIKNPFYSLAPDWALLPMVLLSTMAAVIASQAVISGAFSVTQQAIQLGLLPRMKIAHTSSSEIGQIYIPFINWTLAAFVIGLVVGFGSSTSIAAAYGVAVTCTMMIDTLLAYLYARLVAKWTLAASMSLFGLFLVIDLAYVVANLVKIPDGGWFPLGIGLAFFILLTTWKRGRQLLFERLRSDTIPMDVFLRSSKKSVHRVGGTAIYMTGSVDTVPHALLHNLKHNKVLHERNIMLTVVTADVPTWPEADRLEIRELGSGFWRVVVRFGFMDIADVPSALKLGARQGMPIDLFDASFFLSREAIRPSIRPGMPLWRETLFAWMSRNATSAMDFFQLPPDRVVEVGTTVEI